MRKDGEEGRKRRERGRKKQHKEVIYQRNM
jgi:hypothetical protein